MSERLRCANGHEWEDESASPTFCPECNSASVSATSLGNALPPPPGSAVSVPERLPQIPHYEVREVLGRGGMGVVYRAWQSGLKRDVALKMILAGAHAGMEERLRFQIEAESVARMHHPNIVQIYEIGTYDGFPFFSLEFVDGGTLRQRLADGLPRPDEAGRMVRQLALAIHYAHLRGIVHRDLKPANILLQSGEGGAWTVDREPGTDRATVHGPRSTVHDCVPKIADFGVAKRMDAAQTQSGTIIGTPSYMSPEQAEGSRQVGPATDIYALGAIFYDMLTSQPPFGGESMVDILDKVRREEPVPPRRLKAGIPRDLETICLKCLKKDPAQRYATAQELADDLDRYFSREPIRARPVPRWERSLKWIMRHPVRTSFIGFVLLLAVAGWFVHESYQAARAEERVNALMTADTVRVPLLIKELAPYRSYWKARLARLACEAPEDSRERLHASLALVDEDPGQIEFLVGRLLKATPDEFMVIRAALAEQGATLAEPFWKIVRDPEAERPLRLRAACALAAFGNPQDSRWLAVTRDLVAILVKEKPLVLGKWTAALEPLHAVLVDPLVDLFHDNKRPESERNLATGFLSDFAARRPEVLLDLMLDANEQQFALLWAVLRKDPDQIIPLLCNELAKTMPVQASEEARDELARRQAWAAIALLQLGQTEPVWPLFRLTRDPSRRTYLIHGLGCLGTNPQLVIRRLQMETDTSARRALILSLGEFSSAQLSPAQRQTLADLLLRWYRESPDAGVHSACESVLQNTLNCKLVLDGLPRQCSLHAPREDRRHVEHDDHTQPEGAGWYLGDNEHTLAVFPPVEFWMGSVDTEKGRYPTEPRHRVHIPRSFALAMKETTMRQFMTFLTEMKRDAKELKFTPCYSAGPEGPIIAVTWYEAAQYCRWLSEKAKLPEEEMCYPPIADIKPGMKLPPGFLSRTGYRLPTEAEWEFACRAGTETSRYFGTSRKMLGHYAWFILNSQNQDSSNQTWQVGRLMPNDFGLFDMQGNATEWCQTLWVEKHQEGPGGSARIDSEDSLVVDGAQPRVLRGGSFLAHEPDLRSALRGRNQPALYFDTVGFRIARTLKGEQP